MKLIDIAKVTILFFSIRQQNMHLANNYALPSRARLLMTYPGRHLIVPFVVRSTMRALLLTTEKGGNTYLPGRTLPRITTPITVNLRHIT